MAATDFTGMSAQETLDRLARTHLDENLDRISTVDDWDEGPPLEVMKLRLLARHHDVVEDDLRRRERVLGELLEKVKEIATNTGDQAGITGDLERAVRNVESAVKDRK